MKTMSMEGVKEIAKECIQKQGSHQPQFIFVKDGQATVVVAPFADDEEKEVMKTVMRKYVTEKRPDYYFYISEAWMSVAKKEEIGRKKPSEDPERQEVLIISKFNRDMKNETAIIPFKRKEGEIAFEKEKEGFTDMATSLNFYLEEGAYEERIESEVNKTK